MDLDLILLWDPTVSTTNDLAKAIDNKGQVDMAILDFSKAFKWNTNWSIMEYEAIYLDGSSHFLKIAHSK